MALSSAADAAVSCGEIVLHQRVHGAQQYVGKA